MAKTISIQYTNPVTGAQAVVSVSVDIDRYRLDTEEGATENFFLKSTASGCSPIYENVDDLVADLLDAKPSGHRKGFVQSYVDTAFTSGGTTLSVTPAANTAGFLPNVPCVLMDKYGSVKDWFIPTVVAADMTIEATGSGALLVDAEVGWIVQQAQYQLSPLGEGSMLGIKAQLERPAAPTAVTGSGTVVGGITIAFTKPADAVIQYYDVYCIKAAVVPTAIQPNALASVADRPASQAATGINFTNYFNETTMELAALDAGTYFVGVVAKDLIGNVETNESAIGWSAAITIS